MNICENIKIIRKLKGITQQELSKIINKSTITIKKYESGDILPPIDILEEISTKLNVDLDVLIHGKDILKNNYSAINFLERILGKDIFSIATKLDDIFGFTLDFNNKLSPSFHKFFIEDSKNDKIYYLKVAELLDLNKQQLYNWVFLDKSIDCTYKNAFNEIELRTQESADFWMLNLNFILIENYNDFKIQNLDDLIINGLSCENKKVLNSHLSKFYDDIKRKQHFDASKIEITEKEIVPSDNSNDNLMDLLFSILKKDTHSYNVSKAKLLAPMLNTFGFEFNIDYIMPVDKDILTSSTVIVKSKKDDYMRILTLGEFLEFIESIYNYTEIQINNLKNRY